MNQISSKNNDLDTELLNKIPAGIVILDRNDNQPVFANRKIRDDLKLQDEQELSKELFLDFLAPSERQRFIEISRSEIQPGISEWKSLTLTGKETWTQLRVAPISEKYLLVIVRNIGKIQEILEELNVIEAKYQALVERDPNFLFILKNGVFEYYNKAFSNKLGYSKDEIEKHRSMPTFFVAPDDREKIARFLLKSKRDLITGVIPREKDNFKRYNQPDETTEFNLMRQDGSYIPVHAIVKRVYSGKDIFIQGVLIDLSSIKELQDMKLDFLAMTQHQFRSPLLNLKGYLDFYKKRVKDGISTEEKEALGTKLIEIFGRNVNQLVSITKDLNDVALIQREKFKCNLRGENFNPILQQVIEDLEFLIRNYRIDLIVKYPSNPCIVNLDRDRISQALSNVLENAIRFTGHGIIEIDVTVEKDGQFLKVTVIDNGVGIDSTNLENIGKPFMTFHPSASRLGLGLYLTQEIINAHGGSFHITSPGFNQGTSVTIKLPLLVPLDKDVIPLHSMTESSLNQIIRIAKTSENMLKRLEAVHQLGNGTYSDIELEDVISALEQVILYDRDRTIRNLAGKFYSQIVEKKENAISDAS
ncbi:MAG: ATP-binding protein [Promethearchaeota archaeon]